MATAAAPGRARASSPARRGAGITACRAVTAPRAASRPTIARSRSSTCTAVSRSPGSCRSSPLSTGLSGPAGTGGRAPRWPAPSAWPSRSPGVRRAALDRRVQRRAQRPQVGLRCGRTVAGPFRRHVLRGAHHQARPGDRAVVDERGEAEVGQHHPAVGADAARCAASRRGAAPRHGAPRRARPARPGRSGPPRPARTARR